MDALMGNNPITVLMATYNGGAYLDQQLHSITTQTRQPTRIIISDDGSTDETPDILARFINRAPFPVTIITGPQNGVAQNMLALQALAPQGYVAFADQDDIWLPDKLARAVDALSLLPANSPAIYTACRIITDAETNPQGITKLPHRGPGFANALVQNIAPGNTIMLSPAALALAQSAAGELTTCIPPYHDWWLYQLITGTGGSVVFDPRPVLYYRQHKGNYLGAGKGLSKRLRRLKALFDGTYCGWLMAQAQALECSSDRLTSEARDQLKLFLLAMNGASGIRQPVHVYRQSFPEQLLLRIALVVHRYQKLLTTPLSFPDNSRTTG